MFDIIIDNFSQFMMLIILLLLSAMFSGCETALFSLKPHDMNKIRKHKGWVNSCIISLYNELPDLLLTILLGNMIVNILYFAVATMFTKNIEDAYGVFGGIVFGTVSFCSVLVIGEITPKSLASALRVGFSKAVILPVYYFHQLVFPLRVILRKLIVFFERIVNLNYFSSDHSSEMKALLNLEFDSGNLNLLERNFLDSVINLPEVKVGEMMTSRVDVVSITEGISASEITALSQQSGHSKIPVRNSETDEYIGWINARDFYFCAENEFVLQEHLREFSYFSEFDRCDQVLERFIIGKQRMVCVVDERGSTAGILVLSDILSELFGDFGDEDELPQKMITGSAADVCYIDARLSFRDFKDLFELECSMAGFTTVGGLVVYLLGRNARVGDVVEFLGIELTVISLSKRRINKIQACRLVVRDNTSGETEQ